MVNTQGSSGAISGDRELLYRVILGNRPAPVETYAAVLGWRPDRAASALGELLERGLVQYVESGTGDVVAHDPRRALGREIAQREAELERHRQAVLDLRASVESFDADYRRGVGRAGCQSLFWEDVSEADVGQVVEGLLRGSDGEVLWLSGSDLAIQPAGQRPDRSSERPAARQPWWGGRADRSIVDIEVQTDPEWAVVAHANAHRGDQVRYVDEVPVEFVVYGSAGVLLATGNHRDGRGYVLLKAAELRAAFTALFESMWRVAEPAREQAITPQNTRILELLALGFKDEAIARYLGMGLRTVRRRLAGMMAEHGADNRFQLGLAVARHGLLDDRGSR